MEQHPEQYSERARLEIRRNIHATYSKFGYDLFELALDACEFRPYDDLLDVGCGLGDFIFKIRRSGHLGRLVGIDMSVDVIANAKAESARCGLGAEFRVGNAENLDYPSSCFDCVTALHVIGPNDPEKVIAEMGRVLKANGSILIATNSRMSYPILEKLKEKARQRFGWFHANEWTEGFESEIAPDTLNLFFGSVEEFRYEDTLEYPDAEVLVDLFRSNWGLWSENLSEAEWDRIVDWAREQALELIPEHGYAEEPRSFSLFRCREPLGL